MKKDSGSTPSPRIEDNPEERGRRTGMFFKIEGRDYGRINGHYPSNPYFNGSPEACAYDKGYEDGFNG